MYDKSCYPFPFMVTTKDKENGTAFGKINLNSQDLLVSN